MGDATPLVLPSPFKGWHTDTYPAIDPTRPELSLKGKSAIVTGGAGAIGSATVSALAKAGASLVGIVGRTQQTLDEAKAKLESQYPKTKLVAVTADITSLASLESAFKQIRAHASSPVDILVHNAGHLAQPTTIINSDPKEWWTSFEINNLGAFNSVRAFLPLASPTATIVNISTAAAHFPTAGVRNLSAYSSSKLGALKIFEFVAAENPELHVVSIQPGVIKSEINTKHGELPPMDTPELAGSFAVWSCSEEAKFLRGKLVWANWDVDEMKAKAEKIQGSPVFTIGLAGWPSMS
ncbi:hypothetical protein H2200_001672 [Cladophialophora chaetospira]|uniref:Uncharacterized protein n=1 Tax=Cladophialophora chaetospira TaxID=386627 RepID=A0AA38XLB4_9EURO|nr:hypothetical protein H2200_001672 [Cladophialophora chaetospira]